MPNMPPKRPNILFILADDLGYGDLGCFNAGVTRTPNLDRLLREGVALSQHYAASAMCAPSRAGLLTGRYPLRTGCIDTRPYGGLNRLSLRERTLADLLKTAGYATGLVGKWHCGEDDSRYHPNRRGFDEFVGFLGGKSDYWDWTLDRNGVTWKSDGRYLTDVFTEEAISFLSRHQRESFFLYLAYNAPHYPLQAPVEDLEPFVQSGNFNNGVSHTYAMVRRLDTGIGRVLETLENLGLKENTVVLFASDNGPQFGCPWPDESWSLTRFNCGLNGSKGDVHEGGIRVPMIVSWPDGLDGGRFVHDTVHFVDWLPTLLSVAGGKPPEDVKLDGMDVMGSLRGETDVRGPARFWQWSWVTPVFGYNLAMRDGPWKLVYPGVREANIIYNKPGKLTRPVRRRDLYLAASPEDAGLSVCVDPLDIREHPEDYWDFDWFGDFCTETPPQPELFNIAADPLETNDLAELQAARVARMKREAEAWFESVTADLRIARDE